MVAYCVLVGQSTCTDDLEHVVQIFVEEHLGVLYKLVVGLCILLALLVTRDDLHVQQSYLLTLRVHNIGRIHIPISKEDGYSILLPMVTRYVINRLQPMSGVVYEIQRLSSVTNGYQT